jgi:CRP-like cAMP-binding protein
MITRRYKHGSIVYFENDKSEYIYILKSGRVILTSIKLDTGEEVKEDVKPGEFFGVKSALGKYPREETAQTVGETVLLVLGLADFERLVLQNVNVVRKMLRIFSNQLRRLTKMQREILGASESINPADELFKIGEYYFKTGKEQQALYTYKRYMEYYPDGKHSQSAMQRIKAIESGNIGEDMTPSAADIRPEQPRQREEGLDLTDFTIGDEGPSGGADLSTGSAAPSLTDEMDDFFAGGEKAVDLDHPFGEAEGGKKMDVAEIFYDAMSKFSQESYDEALAAYTSILGIKNLKNESERKIFEKASFEVGRCYLKTGKYNEALNAFSDMIKKFPNSASVKNALFHIGLTYEILKKADKAITYYSKVASMEPRDSIDKLAQKKLKQLQGSQGR